MSCNNIAYQELCAKLYNTLPCCDKLNKESASHSLSSFDRDSQGGLILQLFELGKLFIEKKMVKFYAQGTCMYPCIHPGDVIYIAQKYADEIRIGDIAVYRRFEQLFSHRVIDKGKKNGMDFVITCPDTARSGNDGPSFDKDILGVVSRIERKGKVMHTIKRDYNLAEKAYFIFSLNVYYLRQYLLSKVIHLIRRIQQFSFYRLTARFLFSHLKEKIVFSLQAPLNNKPNSRLYKKISEEELAGLRHSAEEDSICVWKLVLKIDSKESAAISFISRPKNCPFPGCWITDIRIRLRYRRTKVEDELFSEADRLLSRLGVDKINVGVLNENYLENKIFRNLGFNEIDRSANKVTIQRKIPCANLS